MEYIIYYNILILLSMEYIIYKNINVRYEFTPYDVL